MNGLTGPAGVSLSGEFVERNRGRARAAISAGKYSPPYLAYAGDGSAEQGGRCFRCAKTLPGERGELRILGLSVVCRHCYAAALAEAAS